MFCLKRFTPFLYSFVNKTYKKYNTIKSRIEIGKHHTMY